jgi:hypothetical protein
MTGPDHYRSAEGLVAQAEKLMDEDEQAGAAVWATIAQVHATLALAATALQPVAQTAQQRADE